MSDWTSFCDSGVPPGYNSPPLGKIPSCPPGQRRDFMCVAQCIVDWYGTRDQLVSSACDAEEQAAAVRDAGYADVDQWLNARHAEILQQHREDLVRCRDAEDHKACSDAAGETAKASYNEANFQATLDKIALDRTFEEDMLDILSGFGSDMETANADFLACVESNCPCEGDERGK